MRYTILVVAFVLALHPEGRAAFDETPHASGPLVIESNPAGASVYIDGRFSGVTPVSVAKPSNGEHRVRLVLDGYLENGRVVRIGPGRSVVRVTLTRASADAAGSEQVVTGRSGSGGGSKKWIWIGAAAAGAGAGIYAATRSNTPPTISSVTVEPAVALASITSLTLSATAVDADGDSLSYSWDFGDGATGSGQTTNHVYASAGSFQAKVTVKDAKHQATGSGTATIKSITGTWAGNLGSNPNTFFTMTLTQTSTSFSGAYTDTISGNGAVNGGQIRNPRGVAFIVNIPRFSPVSFEGVLDPDLNRIVGNAVGYSGGPQTFYLNRR